MAEPAASKQTSALMAPETAERLFRYLVDEVRDYAIFLLTPEGLIGSWNAGAQHIKGYRPEEIIGEHFRIFYPEKDKLAKKPEAELQIALKTGEFKEEGWRVRKDGSRFWASVLITPIRDEQGRLLGYGKITRDLSERRAAEARYRLLIEGVTDYAIYSLDPQGNITSWNSGAQRIKGYTLNEIIGKNFSLFYTPEDREMGMPQQVLETARELGHFAGEGWRMRKDGSRFWASVVVTAMRDEEGNVTGFSKVTRDVTERQMMLEKIHQHSRELEVQMAAREQSNAELEAFAYSVSHDLRAPLRAIAGFGEALKEEYAAKLDPTGNDYLNEILDATGRMNALVQDLLEYGRVSRINIPLEPVSVADAVHEAMRRAGDRQNLTVEVAADLKAYGHLPTLTQVIINLVDNAFKFHEPGATAKVHVRAEDKGDRVRVSVQDNGIGIAPPHQERIFQVFERLHEREKYSGTGIGLAIVKRGVTRMNGKVGLQSEPGKGSTFWFELPKPK
jgi:PAS domain S-box-containing protein